MPTKVTDTMLPTTMIGSYPKPRWFEDYNVQGRTRGRGVFQSDYGSEDAISFLDLIEVLVAGHMRELGISLTAVRNAYAALGYHLNTQRPFSRKDPPAKSILSLKLQQCR